MEVLPVSPETTGVAKIPPGGFSHIFFTSPFWAGRAGGALLFPSPARTRTSLPGEMQSPEILLQDTGTPLQLWPFRQPWEAFFAHLSKGSSTSQSTLTRSVASVVQGLALVTDVGKVSWGPQQLISCCLLMKLSRRLLSTAGTAGTHLTHTAALRVA